MSNTNSIFNTIDAAQKAVDSHRYNLERVTDPNARKVIPVMRTDQLGGGVTSKITAVETRNVNSFNEQQYVNQITRLANADIYTEFLSDLESVTGDRQVSKFVDSINNFFAQTKILESDTSSAMKSSVVSKARELATVFTNSMQKVDNLIEEADSSLKNDINSLNNTLRAIYDLNQAIQSSGAPIRLFDQRDELIRETARHFEITTRYEKNGTVIIQSAASGELLVDSMQYAEFTYNGDGINGKDDADAGITIARHPKSTIPTIFASWADNSKLSGFKGGRWEALIKLRDESLPATGTSIKTLVKTFTDNINSVHNNSSTFPPKGIFESSVQFSGNDRIDLDPFKIYFVDKKGDQLRGGNGRLNAISIDMKNLPTNLTNGVASVGDLIKELNRQLDISPSRERAAIGDILDNNGIQVDGEYLLNNIQLRAKGEVNATDNNSLVFDLDLQGSSRFGSDIEILEVRTANDAAGNGATNANDLPGIFRLEQDSNILTNQDIRVENVVPGRVITLKVRVTGDNGVVSTGEVSFPVPAQPLTVNDRISFDSGVPGAATQGFDHPGVVLNNHSGVATAKLVDENGNEINPATSVKGKLIIQTNDDKYKLVIEGGNLSQKLGFNNLFEYDEEQGSLKVSERIVNDSNQLSLARISKSEITTTHTVGDTKASATLILGGGALAAGDTVTVGDETFTFVNVLAVPANPNEVLLANGFYGPDGLTDKINAHPKLKNLVEATQEVGNLVIKAKKVGTSGNAIAIASALGGATIDLNDGNGPLGNVAGNLDGGTDKVEVSKIYNYSIKSGNKEGLEELSSLQTKNIKAPGGLITTLSGLATIVGGEISTKINDARSTSKVATIVLEKTDRLIKETSGINREKEYLAAVELIGYLNVLARMLAMTTNSNERIQEIIFSR